MKQWIEIWHKQKRMGRIITQTGEGILYTVCKTKTMNIFLRPMWMLIQTLNIHVHVHADRHLITYTLYI